jgi:hypothetical protein
MTAADGIGDQDAARAMQSRLDDLRGQRADIDEQIRRYEGAIAALNGEYVRPRSGATARKAIVAALATYKAPVRTEDLLDHEALVHYSRHTLRSALADLHHAGEITGTRAPKGFIWEPPA